MIIKLDYIDKVTSKYGCFTLSEYLNHTCRSYSIFLIDYSKEDIVNTDGLQDTDLKEKSKESIDFRNKGIFALYGERHCLSSPIPVEVFMIEKELWESDEEELKELLIFHEVCHLIEKREYTKHLNIVLSDTELNVGEKLAEIADKIKDLTSGWGKDEDHNQIFGAILFHFFKQYDSIDCYRMLAKSMIRNFLDDYTQSFEEVTT